MNKTQSSDLVAIESQIFDLIERGEDSQRICAELVCKLTALDYVNGACIFVSKSPDNDSIECISHSGNCQKQLSREWQNIIFSENFSYQGSRIHNQGNEYIFEVSELGKPKGCLFIQTSEKINKNIAEELRRLAFHISTVNERQRLTNRVQHFLDRLEILNELNLLIAGDIDLQRIVKRLTREAAFRFSSDLALVFLLDEKGQLLEIKGGFGCAANIVPKQIPTNTGILSQVLKLGGNISVPDISQYKDSGLEFLNEINIIGLEVCCLEIHEEVLGVLVIGFREQMNIGSQDLIRFEEFCQGSAVAISTAQTHQRLKRYTDKLEELVEERTAELAYQTDRAEKANQAKSQFLANMSHELRTPLTAIIGYSSVIAEGIFGEINDKQKEGLDAVVSSSEHLKRLIDDVLNLARVESGKEEARIESVPVQELLEHCHKLIMQQAIQKNLYLEPISENADIEKLYIRVDAKHIRQILINLLSNAVKYTPEGGMVKLESEKHEQYLKISITDTGVGISEEKQKKLFQLFERGEDKYSLEQEGTGIGLNLTKRLVELNGGKIGVESVIGHGSTFWILIPIETGEIQLPKINNTIRNKKTRLDGLRALVVDDNSDSCAVLKHLFTSVGAEILLANSVAQAKEILLTNIPDIVLTDLAMPGENGLELIKHIRRGKVDKLNDVPILVLSAFAFDQDREDVQTAGASGFIAKPYRPMEVIDAVRKLTLQRALQ